MNSKKEHLEEPIEKQICEHCGKTYPAGEDCLCQLEIRKKEKRAGLLYQRKHRERRYVMRGDSEVKIDQALALDPTLQAILQRRGIEDMDALINTPVSGLIAAPMVNQSKAAARISEAIDHQQKITIYGDYDVDGVTSVALGLNILGYLGAEVDYYINDRFAEGFGIHPQGVEAIARRGTKLIVTADNGISSLEAASRARDLGIELIVTDHHEPNPNGLPDALVVDHKQPTCDYPNKELVGVGVLFKVLNEVCHLRGQGRRAMHELDLVALGTVADVAKLRGENRVIVKNGLKLMNPRDLGAKKSVRPGIAALRRVAGLGEKDCVQAYHLGFVFGPMINAEGRLEGVPKKAVELLTTQDEGRAYTLAGDLKAINEKRKKLVDDLYDKALEKIDPDKAIFIIADASFEEGVVGLLAARLVKDFYTPAIVLNIDKQGNLKGSGRSIPKLNLKQALDKLSGLLVKYGGHAQACGLTVHQDQYQVVKNMLETQVGLSLSDDHRETVVIDALIGEEDLNEGLFKDMEKLEPFGMGFPKPRLMVKPFKPGLLAYSKDKKHTRLKGVIQPKVDYWAFGQVIEDKEDLSVIVGTTSLSMFRGREQLQFRIESHGQDLDLERDPDDRS